MLASIEGQYIKQFVTTYKPSVTDNDIVDILNLRYSLNNEPIITLKDRDTLVEVLEMLRTLPVTEVKTFLKSATDRNYVIFEQPALREVKERHLRSIINSTAVSKTIKGLGVCPQCKSENIRPMGGRTGRSLDEQTGSSWECASCPAQWSKK